MIRIKFFLYFIFAFIFCDFVIAKPFKEDLQCSYESCPQGVPGMLNVHIIAHSHMDVGWLKTKDQYYYGANNTIQNAGVQYILDSVVLSLLNDPLKQRRFIQVETAYFYEWFQHQPDSIRHAVKGLIKSGQLEFIGGGWSMNDEATCHYNAIIDQMTLGFRVLKSIGGPCGIPKVAWQIDPFGHSREQASLFAQMFFDGLFLGRIDYQDKQERANTRTMEFVWKGSDELGKKAELFTGILPNTYSPPPGFCFDILCGDQAIIDDPTVSEYNVDERATEFIKILVQEAAYYGTNHIVVTMGNDFNYQNANTWFTNLDKLIKYINSKQAHGSKFNIMYSTPSCYLYALNQANVTWTTKSDDFFPYASDPHAYWTGYFTSRPTMKYYERISNNFLQVCKQLDSLSLLSPSEGGKAALLKDAMGIAQHHDAVTGTEKQHVMNDYAKRLAKGTKACQDVVNTAYNKLMSVSGYKIPNQIFCNLLNISQCSITEGIEPVAVTIYNPLAQPIKHYVRLPVTGIGYKVLSANGSLVESQVVPIPDAVLRIPTRTSKAKYELVFEVLLPALGYATYFVKPTNNPKVIQEQMSYVSGPEDADIVVNNGVVTYVIDGETGFLKEVILGNGQSIPFNQGYYFYEGSSGNNTEFEFRASGAYIFRPNGSEPVPITSKAKINAVVKGPLVLEVHQTFDTWVSQVIRLYKGLPYAELDWVVGPIPVEDGIGKEVITKFDTELNTKGIFYTDANGREMQKRIRNYRPTWPVKLSEPVSGNYYPVNSRIVIEDIQSQLQLTVLTDRSQGGSSLKDGSLELMIHRRLLYDDAFGVGEPLDEIDVNGLGLVTRGKHYIILGPAKESRIMHRELARSIYMAPSLSFANYQGTESEYAKHYRLQFSGLQSPLPENVHLLTMEQWSARTLLLRFEHYFDSHDDPTGNLSKPVTFTLKNAFQTFDIESIMEMTLGANQLLAEAKRLKWVTKENDDNRKDYHKRKTEDLTITLAPMEIKTFLAQIRGSP